MSTYEWPEAGRERDRDDAVGRERFTSVRLPDLGLDEALAAARTTAPRGPRVARDRARRMGVPFAPANERLNLWIPLGPMTVVNGQAEGRPRVTGRVRSLSVHPDGDRLYAAAANGGIWYSGDGGGTWRSIGGLAATDTAGITRPAHRHACGAILVHFGAGEALDEVFVGTGEITPRTRARPGSRLGGVGIFVATGPASSTSDDPWVRESKNLVGEGVYRLAAEPDGTRIVAATSMGLLERPAAPGADVDWTRVDAEPFDAFEGVCTDVLWTAGDGPRPARLWVWATGKQAGLWVRADGETAFTKIATPNSSKRRSALAASTPPTRVYVFNNRYATDASSRKPALYRVDAAGATLATADEVVDGVPDDVLGEQGDYDIAVTVHPTNPDLVVLGGMALQGTNPAGDSFEEEDAAIFAAEVGLKAGKLTYGHAAAPAMIGVGAHSDVHDLWFADGGDSLFAACDGGVFRSDSPTDLVGFVARNDGLAVVESNYVASHPTCEGFVVVGLQDNGIIERVSTGVWRTTGEGDAGGVAFDPVDPSRYVRQKFEARWVASAGGGFAKMLRRGASLTDDGRKERDDAAFYSTPAAIRHTRGGTDVGQVLIGTDRLWYTDDWGSTWATLPTASDPITAATYNRKQDQLREPIIVCRWAGTEVAWALGEGIVVRYARKPGTAPAATNGPGAWTREVLLKKGVKNKKDETSAEGPVREAVAWTDLAVNPEAGGAQRGTRGAVYLGTTGHRTKEAVDTLWWFDGTDTWYPTKLRERVGAPVTAVLCDPANPHHVYVGTTVGVFRGVRTLAAGHDPAWVWESLVNGLPEAAVEDLSLFDSGGVRLLRAAIASRGVWELELDAEVVDLTYLRAHDDDLRRRLPSVDLDREGSLVPRSWHGSPDVRPRLVPTAVPAPSTLPWVRDDVHLRTEPLRRFQAALRSQTGDLRCRPTGRWDLYFEEVLRDHGFPTDALGDVLLDEAHWNATMVAPHATADPWGPGRPSEADLHDFTPRLREGDATETSCSLPDGRVRVDVVVHRRGLGEVDGADVRVTLLHWIDPKTRNRAAYDDAGTWFGGDVPWTGAVNDVLNSAGGTTSKTFGQGWAFTESGSTRRRTLAGQTLDSSRSGIVTFDIDLRGARTNLVVLLVAVLRAGSDVALAKRPLRDLVLESPNVAVRSLRVNPS
ncbi:MAG TPA: hypothetical protein VLB86_04120 [Gaiellaceae bacterium]|nr:hypothetical protein [Gaiellaceae bacterium]